jgi:type I restriction enzyme S subunit
MIQVLKLAKLKYLESDKLQYGANESSDRNEEGEPRYIRITDLNEDGSLRKDTLRTLPLEIAQPYLLRDGDILLARSGATVGKSFIYHNYFVF